jgi:hypothetical protein
VGAVSAAASAAAWVAVVVDEWRVAHGVDVREH